MVGRGARPVDGPAPAPREFAVSASPLAVRVSARRDEADGIASFELRPADGGLLPAFTAGAHIDVHLPNGMTRPYSLCNDPAERHRYRIAVLREPAGRGGSAALHDQVREGDLLTIGAPRNQFALAEGGAHALLLAGGIGITPLLAMAWQLHAQGTPFALHYGARSAARMAFADALQRAPFAAHVHLHLDDGPAAQRLDCAALLAAPQPGRHLYACGPAGFLDHVRATAAAAGWPDAQVHMESFTATAPAAGDTAFDLVLQRSGRVVRVAANQTAADALAAHGVAVPLSCQQGVCGTCLTPVLDGEVDHRDLYLSPDEQRSNTAFLPCCSRARGGRLVVDL